MAEFAAMFIWLAIVVGLLAGKSLSDIAKGIVAGSKTMLGACMIVGSARSIALILTDGGVMDTIVHFLAGGLDLVPTILQAPAMFLICTVFNVFMASGSGQAAVMMPLLLPVADRCPWPTWWVCPGRRSSWPLTSATASATTSSPPPPPSWV